MMFQQKNVCNNIRFEACLRIRCTIRETFDIQMVALKEDVKS
jgi:hypothetical protein